MTERRNDYLFNKLKMKYTDTLSAEQKVNLIQIVKAMKTKGLTNQFLQAGVCAIVSKESEFKPQSENLNYSAEGLRKVFPSTFTTIEMATDFAHKPELIANKVYGSKGGNNGLGYKYRGRGYNQITFYDAYKKIGDQLGIDLVTNPDILNQPEIASQAVIQFFINGLKSLQQQGKLMQGYHVDNINLFANLNDAIGACYHVNTGIGKTVQLASQDSTGGRLKAFERGESIYELIKTL